MIAQSQSGTGKTAAFVLSMLSRIDMSKPFPQVIVYFYSWSVKIAMGVPKLSAFAKMYFQKLCPNLNEVQIIL